LLLGIISPSDVSPLVSLQLFVAVLIGGAQWWGPVLGVAIVSVLPWAADQLANATGTSAEHLRGVLTALLLFAVLVLRSLLRGRLRHPMRLSTEAPQMYAGTTKDHVAAKKQPIELSAAGLRISYAGVQALDRISIALRGGKVHALVGPNGSGKSTLLAVLAGELRHGEIRINGKLHRARSVRDRVLAGIVRTPQPAQVFTSLTPAGQVALGARAASRLRGAALRQLLATPRSRVEVQRVRATVADALCETGLERISDTDPAQLTVGERQLLQVARAIATGASVFLFDEPAAGMTPVERKVLADVVRGLTAGGAAVLLVEHDMRLVGAVADYVSVIDAGRTIAAGSPERIRIEPRVREVYLGSS
jgi:ABC-type branched-subunit amino acid transport system ATPase component